MTRDVDHQSVVVRRVVNHSPARVFAAFTKPEQLATWFAPLPDLRTRVTEHHLRVGGCYRFEWTFESGATIAAAGAFTEVTPEERLAFSWCWEEPDVHAGIDTHVVIDIAQHARGAAITITHTRLRDKEMCERHEGGWNGLLDQLTRCALSSNAISSNARNQP